MDIAGCWISFQYSCHYWNQINFGLQLSASHSYSIQIIVYVKSIFFSSIGKLFQINQKNSLKGRAENQKYCNAPALHSRSLLIRYSFCKYWCKVTVNDFAMSMF